MTTTKPKAAAAARIGGALAARKRSELLALLRPCFARVGPWLQAGKYVAAVASGTPKRNGWTIAQQAGDRVPQRTQRLLNRAAWDTFAAMGVVRRFAVAGLDEAARHGGRQRGLRVAAIDETSQVKQGSATAGVKRHYLGCVGKVANGITTVHLSYVRERTGHALIGARPWIPAEQIDDPVRSLVMGLPLDLVFRTKGQLAIDIFTEAFSDGIKLDFACGDEVYGACTEAARVLGRARPGLCTAGSLHLPPHAGPRGHHDLPAGGCPPAGQLPRLGGPLRWDRLQGPALVCVGAAGHRLAAASLADPPPPGQRRTGLSLLFRPEGQRMSMARLIRAAGLRWPVEEDFEFGKDRFGLDQSQVRLYTAIARHTVLVMAALAICTVTAALLRHRTDTQAPPPVQP